MLKPLNNTPIDNQLASLIDEGKINCYTPPRNIVGHPNIYYSNITLPNSNYCCNKGLFLPSYITIDNNEIIYICKLIKLWYNSINLIQ